MSNVIEPVAPFTERDETGNVLAKLITQGWFEQSSPPLPKKYWKNNGTAIVEMDSGEKAAVDAAETKDALVQVIIDGRLSFKNIFLAFLVQSLADIPYTKAQVGSVIGTIATALTSFDHGLIETGRATINGISASGNFTSGIKTAILDYIDAFLAAEVP